ncbi:putative inactive shikimate kinase like 2, chloroplastic [Vitis vinifera]|uniref:Putative inactive shikimate kinase like 2, chloroplastic n=1 Tax=Vitis vinifera TaxID=29760 RepID=A0A438JZD0_VITVI|nr:putative inactive shikimate kinase like 2, chloroplastic [Vitis vinifera]
MHFLFYCSFPARMRRSFHGVTADGSESVAEAESAVLENLSSHVRAVIATLGGLHGAARRADKWRHLYAGFTVWLSQSEAIDEESAKEEARRHIQEGSLGYSNADVVVKLHGWDADHAKTVAQASLSALKQLIMSDKKLPGKKSLYIRLGCRGDWPDIKPPGWDPLTGAEVPAGTL